MSCYYIVTIKLPKRSDHDPRNKKIGTCRATPILQRQICTDESGEHHSVIIETATEMWPDEVQRFLLDHAEAWWKWDAPVHITRIEGPISTNLKLKS